MKKELIVRAWKDPEFRASLTSEERAALPESPSGSSLSELAESELLGISGGRAAKIQTSQEWLPTCANTCGVNIDTTTIVPPCNS